MLGKKYHIILQAEKCWKGNIFNINGAKLAESVKISTGKYESVFLIMSPSEEYYFD